MGYKERSTTFFEFAEGQELEGVFVGTEEIQLPDKEETATRYTMVVKEGARVSFLGGAALDRTFREQSIAPGAQVKIKYEGDKDLQGGRKVKLYRVWVWEDDEDPAPDNGGA
jgi:hypothetical protein